MIKIENVEVMGWRAAIRGMRNPLNSWKKSDSDVCYDRCEGGECPNPANCDLRVGYCIGPNDHDLMTRLRNAGTDHRKFMRMITVYLDIAAPLYWWKEFDTYKVGTVVNSCSTMHKIADKEFTLDDFSRDHIDGGKVCAKRGDEMFSSWDILKLTIDALNYHREQYLETVNHSRPHGKPEYRAEIAKHHWWQMIQLLPSSYNQRRTVMLNYEVLANIYKSRRNHKLDEWVEFCKWIENLPYSELITGQNDKKLKITSYDDDAGPIIPALTPAQGKELTDAMSLIREENE